MSSSDSDLVRRLASGDELTFEGFFGEYFARVYRFALTRLRGFKDGSEEVVKRRSSRR
jgi:hypothetical protein